MMNNSHTYLSPLCMPLLTTWTWDLLMLSYFWWNLVSNQTERIVLSSSLCFFLCKQPERKWEFQLETATWRSPSPAQQLKSNNVGFLWRIHIDIWTRGPEPIFYNLSREAFQRFWEMREVCDFLRSEQND